jgi:hypothetical protein
MNVMKRSALYAALFGTSILVACGGGDDEASAPTVVGVEFVGMAAPATAAEKADAYTAAKVVLTYSDQSVKTLDLQYSMLMGTGDVLGGKVVGGIYDANDQPISDASGPLAYDAPDGTSLLSVSGLNAADPNTANALALVNHFEYKELPPAGQSGSF